MTKAAGTLTFAPPMSTSGDFQTRTSVATSEVTSRHSGRHSIWSYTFDEPAVSTKLPTFTDAESVWAERLPPNHPAWIASWKATKRMQESGIWNKLADDWLDNLRADSDARLDDLYGSDDWE